MKTVFYQAVVDDCEAETLDMAGMVVFATNDDAYTAFEKLAGKNMKSNDDFSVAYTAGHYGEEDHQWVFSHHEIYEPQNPELPTMVILRYRPK